MMSPYDLLLQGSWNAALHQLACRILDMTACQAQWQKEIAIVALPWLQHAIDKWEVIRVKHKDDHLDQALLFMDSEMEVLVHCFDEAGAMSYVHNHKASFISLCLSGSYTESKWIVDQDLHVSHIEYQRQVSGICVASCILVA